jgi:hypothetical protein
VGRETITVSAWLAHRIPTFLANRRADLRAMRDWLATGEYGRIQALAHNIKGVGGAYGFERMSELARTIETAALARDAAALRSAIDEMGRYLENIDVVFV